MPRYYFDIRENREIAIDELGTDLADLRAAEIEAAQSVIDMVRELPLSADHHEIEIAVRTEAGPLFKAALAYQIIRQ